MSLGSKFAVLMCAALGLAGAAAAQDTRVVTEPKIPATCVKLEAKLSAPGDALKESDETREDTARIQEAVDGFAAKCQPGQAVELARGTAGANAFLAGPLELKEGVTLLVDKGVTLFASRDPKDYDVMGPGTCGTLPAKGPCKSLITIRAKNVAIMGDGVIDGRGGAKMLGQDLSWWGLAVKAETAGGGNQGAPYSDPRLITASNADGLVLYRITLHDSPNFHVGVNRTNGFTAWGVHLKTPVHQPGPNDPRPRNTDGIDPGSSTNVTIAHSWIDNGDDNIAIKTGTTHMSVIDNHFYSGHGMSIGSETYSGVSDLLVDGLTEDHTTSGIRIKSNASRGGLVENLTYRNICMRDVPIPIAISPYYNGQTAEGFVDPGVKGNRIPEYKNLTLENITSVTPGDVLIAGYDEAHRTDVTLDGVFIDGIKPSQVHGHFATVTVGPFGTNIDFSGTDLKRIDSQPPAKGYHPQNCSAKFLPMQ